MIRMKARLYLSEHLTTYKTFVPANYPISPCFALLNAIEIVGVPLVERGALFENAPLHFVLYGSIEPLLIFGFETVYEYWVELLVESFETALLMIYSCLYRLCRHVELFSYCSSIYRNAICQYRSYNFSHLISFWHRTLFAAGFFGE